MRKRIKNCLWCGLRVGVIQSAFCARDAKRLSIKLIDSKHRTHFFTWNYLMTDEVYGKSIVDMLKDTL